MRFLILAALLFAGCAAPETPSAPAADSTASALQRPNAQNPGGNPEGEVPPGWLARFDHEGEYVIGANADSADVFFVTMTPGWHITAKPAGIYWHPASTAEGNFVATAKIHLFDPGDRNEAYGLFVGGSDLEGPNQAYLYFLVRRSGEFLVKRRAGEETFNVIDWTANPAIVPYTAETQGTAENTLTLTVSGGTIAFAINGTEVATVPAEGIVTDGIAGLRVNHGLNLHVENFAVEPAATM